MTKTNFLWTALLLAASGWAQNNPSDWTVHNRNVDFNMGVIHLDAREDDGFLWLKDSDFSNGTLEVDLKGEDVQGASFVGLAFNGKDDETFDAVYLRPFNFKNTERKDHSVQYVSAPDYGWSKLREAFPGKYENQITPAPDPNSWIHVRLVVDFPSVKVYINQAEEPSLVVDQITPRGHGQVGLWVGFGSQGWFKNLSITPKFDQPAKKVFLDVAHGQRFYKNLATTNGNEQERQRTLSMTYELQKSLAPNNAYVTPLGSNIGPKSLNGASAVLLHVPSLPYTDPEIESLQDFVKNGGSLFVVMDEAYWSSLEETRINTLLKPFGMAIGEKIPDTIAGGHTVQSAITPMPLKIPYHGGRRVSGGTPFCYGPVFNNQAFGAFNEIPGGGKLVVMGEGMVSLYMTEWQGVTDYQCQEFMTEVFNWLLN